MSDDLLLIRWQERVCHLTLNRPDQGNALSAALVGRIDEALAQARARQAHAVVIEGAGRHFCTGFDLSALEGETDHSLLSRFVRIELMLQSIARAPFATVAVAHGRTLGAGADLFACCDGRIARDDCVFAFPGLSGFGLVLGSGRLAARVGARQALQWIGSGCPIRAEEALAAGLASQIADKPSVGAAIQQAVSSPADAELRDAVHRAVHGDAVLSDARDLDLLVRSAARPGLQERIAAYLRAGAARKNST